MANQKFIDQAPRSAPRLDPIEIACRERVPLAVAVLESIMLNTLESGIVRRTAARDILEFAGGKPAVRVTQEVNVNHGPSPIVIENMSEAKEKADMTMLVTQWARKMIPFDQWPAAVQEAALSSD